MYKEIFGSTTAGRVLMFVARNGEGYTREIAAAFEVSPQMVHEQLLRFERAGMMKSRRVGTARLFALHPDYPARGELFSLLERVHELLPVEERDKIARGSHRNEDRDRDLSGNGVTGSAAPEVEGSSTSRASPIPDKGAPSRERMHLL